MINNKFTYVFFLFSIFMEKNLNKFYNYKLDKYKKYKV